MSQIVDIDRGRVDPKRRHHAGEIPRVKFLDIVWARELDRALRILVHLPAKDVDAAKGSDTTTGVPEVLRIPRPDGQRRPARAAVSITAESPDFTPAEFASWVSK